MNPFIFDQRLEEQIDHSERKASNDSGFETKESEAGMSAHDPSPSVSFGPISSPLMWPPGIPVVAAVEWRAPELKSKEQWSKSCVESVQGTGFFPYRLSEEISRFVPPLNRVSVRVSP